MKPEESARKKAPRPRAGGAGLHLAALAPRALPEEPPAAPLPVAIAAITVAGQCRERSPADEALFGEAGERFIARFADAADGQALLAAAVADGAAEGRMRLRTAAGYQTGRVSLWRQRGGERIRIVAAIAVEGGSSPERAETQPGRAPLTRDMLAGGGAGTLSPRLGRPLEAAIALASRLRLDGGAAVDDVIAVLWRVRSLLGRSVAGGPGPMGGEGEVDLLHLTRRAMRVADPAAAARAISLELPRGGAPVIVVADQQLLWGLIDAVLFLGLATLPRGGALGATLEEHGGAFVLRFAAERVAPIAGAETDDAIASERAEAERLAVEAGVALRLSEEPSSFDAALSFPPERCLALP